MSRMETEEVYACELQPGDTILRHGKEFLVEQFRDREKEGGDYPTLDEGYVELIVSWTEEAGNPNFRFRLHFEELTPMELVRVPRWRRWTRRLGSWGRAHR